MKWMIMRMRLRMIMRMRWMIMSISTTICDEQGKKILTWIRHLKRLFVLPGFAHGEFKTIIQHLELVWVGFRRGGEQVYED